MFRPYLAIIRCVFSKTYHTAQAIVFLKLKVAILGRLSLVKIKFEDSFHLFVVCVCVVAACNIHTHINVCVYIYIYYMYKFIYLLRHLYLRFRVICGCAVCAVCLPVRVSSVSGAAIHALFMCFRLCCLCLWGSGYDIDFM
jgi:hypothetical protein